MTTEAPKAPTDFIRSIIADDVKAGKHGSAVVTRFPPEPNGYPHIGHSKAISLNFDVAREFGGRCHLRFDDTNPTKEEDEYVNAIKEDISWLGFDWGEHEYYASSYFDQLYAWAEQLVESGLAYVCDLSAEETRKYRGTLTEAGINSPYRDRSVEENLDLLRRMKAGEFPNGARTLRAKIDMASPNINMRDPVLYRILKESHHRTGDAWCIYPMYDFAHGQSDSIEGITHSLCTLEFEAHRPLYDWFIEKLGIHAPQQIEFGRLNITYTIMSKRKLLQLVDEGHVDGWDDPRMPTIRGLRRAGYTPDSIKSFARGVGITKRDGPVDVGVLEETLRSELNKTAPRVMAVLRPLKVVIENYPEDQVEELEAVNNPEDESAGKRLVPFSREIYIERDDFMEDPPRKFHRLSPGKEVRLRWAYFITCTDVVKDASGAVVEVRCTYDPATRGGDSPDGRKVKGTLHWVSAARAVEAEVRLYDRLFRVPNPNSVPEGGRFLDHLNPDSLETLTGCKLEPSLADADVDTRYQFERLGYFVLDRKDSKSDALVFNRTVSLRDKWARIEQQAAKGGGG